MKNLHVSFGLRPATVEQWWIHGLGTQASLRGWVMWHARDTLGLWTPQ